MYVNHKYNRFKISFSDHQIIRFSIQHNITYTDVIGEKFIRYNFSMFTMRGFFLVMVFFIISLILLLDSVNDTSLSEESFNHTQSADIKKIDVSDLAYDINSNPFNISYTKWTEKWWQWAYSIPWDTNPSYDDSGKYCDKNQNGPVWFLTLAYQHSVKRICNIPENTALLMTLLNSECSLAEFPFLKNQELGVCAKSMQDHVIGGNASINGIQIPNMQIYRIQSDVFNFTLPENNILDLPPQTTQAISDGNWLFLKPLPIGKYELKLKGNIKTMTENETNSSIDKYREFAGPIGWNYTTTYMLTVK